MYQHHSSCLCFPIRLPVESPDLKKWDDRGRSYFVEMFEQEYFYIQCIMDRNDFFKLHSPMRFNDHYFNCYTLRVSFMRILSKD